MSTYTCITKESFSDEYYINNLSSYKYIIKYNFENGLTYYFPTNNYRFKPKDIIMKELIAGEFSNFKRIKSIYDLQQYYSDNFEVFISYHDLQKIWNYYTTNKLLITQIIDSL